MFRRRALIAVTLTLALAAFAAASAPGLAAQRSLRMNEIQVIGTHNSYHRELSQARGRRSRRDLRRRAGLRELPGLQSRVAPQPVPPATGARARARPLPRPRRRAVRKSAASPAARRRPARRSRVVPTGRQGPAHRRPRLQHDVRTTGHLPEAGAGLVARKPGARAAADPSGAAGNRRHRRRARRCTGSPVGSRCPERSRRRNPVGVPARRADHARRRAPAWPDLGAVRAPAGLAVASLCPRPRHVPHGQRPRRDQRRLHRRAAEPPGARAVHGLEAGEPRRRLHQAQRADRRGARTDPGPGAQRLRGPDPLRRAARDGVVRRRDPRGRQRWPAARSSCRPTSRRSA